jgi:Big-like domain-containing protein/alpha-2-macroglobulin family protein
MPLKTDRFCAIFKHKMDEVGEQKPELETVADQKVDPAEISAPTERVESTTDAQTTPPTETATEKPDQPTTPTDHPAHAVTSDQVHKGRHWPRLERILPPFIRRPLGKAARPVSYLLILIILAGAGFASWHFSQTNLAAKPVARFNARIVAFKVISTTPSLNQTNVAPTTPITIQFSQPVNPQKLNGNLFTTPMVSGTFTQGATATQAVFTPTVPFTQGTKVQVMLNGTFQSEQGTKLGANYMYGFTTSLPSDGVSFQDSNGLYATVSSAKSGQQLSYTLEFGNNVAAGTTITLYKADMNQLLNSLIYKNVTSNGYTYPSYVGAPIDTNSMQVLSTQKNINNGSTYNVTQDSGIYLAMDADSNGNQLGYVWIDYADFGVMAREDDQKIVLDAQNLSTSSDTSATVQVYNLLNSVQQLDQTTVDGLTTISLPFNPSADLVVASDGTSQALTPLSILESQGDIRVDQDLSAAPTVFGTTDKPTYKTTDTVRYAGWVRANQDTQYGTYNSNQLSLYVASYPGEVPQLASFSATVASNGSFSGSFPISASWLNGDTSDQFQIYAVSPTGNAINDQVVASFTVTSQAEANDNVTVSFSQSSYLPTDAIKATITATDGSGSPLVNGQVDVHTFSVDYYENDPTANLTDLNDVGTEITGSPTTVQLNASGQAVVSVNPAHLPSDGSSQLVTIQANVHGVSGPGAAGGASAVVHQGNGILTFGVGRDVVASGAPLVGRIYATTLSGGPLGDAQVDYSLSDQAGTNPVTVATGSVTTDSTGYAEISINLPSSVQVNDALQLNVWTSDANNNKIQASSYYYVQGSDDTQDTSGAALQDLDVSGSSGTVSVGQKVNLVINSPAALNALISMDRGRIYNAQMLNLNSGNNDFSFTVSSNLAPSFTLTFNYFENGIYHSEGVQFNVNNPADQANIQLTPSNQTVTANQATSVQIAAQDSSGNPLPTNLLVDVVSANAYNLYAQVVPNMYGSLYPTLPIMTSSSSSLSSIGSGGGRCGGGGGGVPNNFTNPLGTTLLWQPSLSTDNTGKATISFTPPKGSWQINVYSMSGSTIVAQASTTITAK